MTSKREVRTRALRITVGALLSADFRDEELRELAEEIDSVFALHLKGMLLNVVAVENSTSREPNIEEAGPVSPPTRDVGTLGDILYDHVRAKKIGRARLLRYLEEISPRLIKSKEANEASSQELVTLFLTRATKHDAIRLLGKVAGVSGPMEEDPYLTGITTRREK
jgi:hypothetical protein